MATHSSVLAWRSCCTEEPGGLQSLGSQRVRRENLVTKQQIATPVILMTGHAGNGITLLMFEAY